MIPKYELTDEMVKNLMIFLDRVPFQGWVEHEALSNIKYALSRPFGDEPTSPQSKETTPE